MKKAFLLIFFFKTSLFLSQELPEYISEEGLLVWLPFNGTTEDKSQMGFHATNFGAQSTEDRFKRKNSALYLNGIGNYI